MIKVIIAFTFLLFPLNHIIGQDETIELPIDVVDTFDPNQKHHVIELTNNIEIFFNKEKVLFWDQISTKILEEARTPKMNAVKHITVYADKSLDYRILDRLRSEIGKVWTGYLHFMGKKSNDKNCLSFYIQGSPMSKKNYPDYDWNYGHSLIFTKNQRLLKEEVVFSKTKAQVESPIFAIWQSNFLSSFYGGRLDLIKRYLEDKKFSAIQILTNEHYLNEKQTVSFSSERIRELVKENDILFIRIDKMSYQSYYKAMAIIQKNRYEQPNHGELRKPFIIEVSHIFENELKDEGLNFFKE